MYNTFGGYIKKSFKDIFDNTSLFIPVIFNLLLAMIPIGLVFLFPGFKPPTMNFPPKGITIAVVILASIIMIVFQLFILAGRLNMIKQVVLGNNTSIDDFWEGIRKYTGKIFLGGLMIFGVLLIFMLIVMLPMIGLGMTRSFLAIRNGFLLMALLIIPIIVISIFLSFWLIIIVYDDCGIKKSFKLSWSFVKKNFGLVLVMNILKGIFTGNGNKNRNNSDSLKLNGFSSFNMPMNLDVVNIGLIVTVSIIISAVKLFFTL